MAADDLINLSFYGHWFQRQTKVTQNAQTAESLVPNHSGYKSAQQSFLKCHTMLLILAFKDSSIALVAGSRAHIDPKLDAHILLQVRNIIGSPSPTLYNSKVI